MNHDAHHEAQAAFYGLMAGAEGCGPAARAAGEDELADLLLCEAREEIVGKARRLLSEWAAG